MKVNSDYSKSIFFLLVFFAMVVLGILMKVLHSFLIPVVIAVLLSCVFYKAISVLMTKMRYPIKKILKKKYKTLKEEELDSKVNQLLKIPYVIGITIMLLLLVVIIASLSTVLTASVTTFAKQYSNYEEVFLRVYELVANKFHLQFNGDKNFIENIWGFGKVREMVQSLAVSLSGSVITFAKNFGLILLYIVFFLIELQRGDKKINAIFHGKNNSRIVDIKDSIVDDVLNFLTVKFLISILTGTLTFVCCIIAKVDFAILWAFLAFLMNFIPTFGSIFSVLITTLFTFLQYFPNPFWIIFVFIFMTAINMILGNIVEPSIEGDKLGLSSFVILVSLTFWGWMWGFIGMILAVPLMVIVKIICEKIPSTQLKPLLNPIAIILGNGKIKEKDTEENSEEQV